jgi:hypothetical protein
MTEPAKEMAPWWEDDPELEETEGQIVDYDIAALPNDFNVNTIFNFIEARSINIPGFQRNYVWDKKRASRLIESLIIGIPVPQIFLYEKGRNDYLVIDGQQRLMSIYYFKKMRFPLRNKRAALRIIYAKHGGIPDEVLYDDAHFESFNLQLPEITPDRPNRFNGLNYSTLDEDHRVAFDLRVVRNVIIKQYSPREENDSSAYEIFNRLNWGGIGLTVQEFRSSLYHSAYYDMLQRINVDARWRKLLGVQDPDLHMKDIEILLRGFAILINGAEYKPSMMKFLNAFSKACEDMPEAEISYLESLFNSFLDACELLSKDAFYGGAHRFSVSMYEAVFSTICDQAYKEKGLLSEHISAEKLKALKSDKTFSEACRKETTSAKNVAERRKRAREILLG